jgi:hypothetical protein
MKLSGASGAIVAFVKMPSVVLLLVALLASLRVTSFA